MNDSIYSLAYLQYTHEVLKKDIVDAYVPMICQCILKKGFEIIDETQIKKTMSEIYGIENITYGAISTICERMSSSKYEILSKNNGNFYVQKDKLAEHQVSLQNNNRFSLSYLGTSISAEVYRQTLLLVSPKYHAACQSISRT